jgi:hypothetical protein
MYLMLALGCVVLLLGAVLLWRWRTRRAAGTEVDTVAATPQAQLHRLRQSARFWGVSVESHCGASSHLAGRRFPFESVPDLPVAGCQKRDCQCRLIGLPDRRSPGDRRMAMDRRLRGLRMDAGERRAGRPRRRADRDAWIAHSHL